MNSTRKRDSGQPGSGRALDGVAAGGPVGTHQLVLAVVYCDNAAPCLGAELRRLESMGDAVDVCVLAPALNSRLGFWCNDDAEAIAAATDRAEEVVSRLDIEGDVRALIGDPDPLLAIGDVLSQFPADRLILATADAADADRREHPSLRPARCFGRPVTHLAMGPSPLLTAGPSPGRRPARRLLSRTDLTEDEPGHLREQRQSITGPGRFPKRSHVH